MPRASWNGFLRLSLVSCPVALVPATTEAKRVRFNQLNSETGNRVQQQLVDAQTGEVIDRDQIVKGYEYERGRYVTIDDDELKALQIESSKIVDLGLEQGARMRALLTEERYVEQVVAAVDACAMSCGARPEGTQNYVAFEPIG